MASVQTYSVGGRYLRLTVVEESYSIANNTSTVRWTLESIGGSANYYSIYNWGVWVNGQTIYGQQTTAWNSYAFPAAKGSTTGTITIPHNADGSASNVGFTLKGSVVNNLDHAFNGSISLTKIPRAATLTAAPHFNDEENPTITYSNPAGSAVESLQACIANEAGTVVYADYRDIPINDTSYTFELTDEERNNLRWATINSPNLTVKFYVTTVIGGNTYYSTLDKIMTITNAEPTLVVSAKDVGTASTVLTGNDQVIIKGFNYVSVSQVASAYKGASIKSHKITCGGQVINAASGSFNGIESGDITFTATDSRGYSVVKTVSLGIIDYIKLTCNIDVKNPNAEGKTTVKINGNYFNGSFGAQNNTLTIEYRIKKNNDSYGEWKAVTASISGNTYSVSFDEIGLDYRAAYTFQARAKDKIFTDYITSIEKKVKSIPVFDWGENDFKFNIDVYDKNNNTIGTTIEANDYDAIVSSGKALLESGWVSITPTAANTPTQVTVSFKRNYSKTPVVLVTPSSGVIGTQVLGASVNGITSYEVNIVLTRINTIPTTVYYYVFGEVE